MTVIALEAIALPSGKNADATFLFYYWCWNYTVLKLISFGKYMENIANVVLTNVWISLPLHKTSFLVLLKVTVVGSPSSSQYQTAVVGVDMAGGGDTDELEDPWWNLSRKQHQNYALVIHKQLVGLCGTRRH